MSDKKRDELAKEYAELNGVFQHPKQQDLTRFIRIAFKDGYDAGRIERIKEAIDLLESDEAFEHQMYREPIPALGWASWLRKRFGVKE